MPVTLPPVTVSAVRSAGAVSQIGSLNTSCNANSVELSCPAGKLSKRAVSGALGTETATPCDNIRPSAVQIALSASHEGVASRDMLTSALLCGIALISHRSLRLSTCRTLVTVPWVTISICRIAASVVSIGSLNASCTANSVEPLCPVGKLSKRAVSGALGTETATPRDKVRPSAVQTAPGVAQDGR